MNSSVEQILQVEECLLNDECVVCYKKFINIKDKKYTEFYNKIKDKYKLNKYNIFEDETICMCYDSKFECLTCKNFVCCGCIMNTPDYENGEYIDKYNEKFEYHDMEFTGIITCPICRTKDYKLLYKYVLHHVKSYKKSAF
jgi:hypothetical protein